MAKRIAILADFPWSFFAQGATGRGGGQACTWLAQLAEEFAKGTGYEIHWVSLDRSLLWGRVEHRTWGGQFFHKIPGGKVKVDLALGYRPSRYLLLRQLRRIQPDLIHAWGTERSYPVACGALGVPSILSMQGVLSNLLRKGYLPKIWVWMKMAKLEPTFLRSAALVTCESQWAMERVREVAVGADIRQVEYGVYPGFYEIIWEPNVVQPYALFVGTLVQFKGVDVLLDALHQIGECSWKVKFAGDGPLRKAVESCALPNVEWLGMLPWVDLQREMKHATCLIHPTLADSSPNVVKEARVIGLPVITTLHGGQAGYIRDGENGLIVEPLDASGLASALSRVMDDPQLARRMGAARHAEDRDYFRASRTARGFLEIYAELLARLRLRPKTQDCKTQDEEFDLTTTHSLFQGP
jgi:glycosyltransferase involved in cell wall biosynthesis